MRALALLLLALVPLAAAGVGTASCAGTLAELSRC
jgi:hypothetical protein